MNSILLITIAVTVIISVIVFQNPHLFQKYNLNVGAVKHRREYYRLLTSGFLHVDWMHLLFNMLTLYFFGPIVVNGFGEVGFLIIYIGAILTGNLLSVYIYRFKSMYTAVGASGGVSGVLFSAIAIYPQIGIMFFFIPIPIPGYIFGALYFSYSVYMMLKPRFGDNIGHSAHLGGAMFGLVYAMIAQPEYIQQNAMYLGIMALPLLYMSYEIFIRKKIL